ncbi:hypothetical protein RUND412_003613 [Rhizina undulata]
MASTQPNTALVFGASGITGWALCNNLLSYPSKETFSRVIGLTNRPLTREDAQLPADERLTLHSGLDLLGPYEDVKRRLSEVQGIDGVTHVYFGAYKEASDFQELRRINTKMLENAVKALEEICPSFRFIVLQTGGKAYGVEFPENVAINAPLSESLPRIPSPYAENVFYYNQVDLLKRASEGKSWKWCEVRPDVIVGFVPNNNAMNVAQPLALFLSLYHSVYGPGARIPFPGTEKSWLNKHTDTSHDLLARFEIYASLNPEKTHAGTFNIADSETPVTWSEKWPVICKYFGLEGVGPHAETSIGPQEWMKRHQPEWAKLVLRKELNDGRVEKSGWGFLDCAMRTFDFDRQYDLTRARGIGFEEKIDTVEGFKIAFRRMRAANIIPTCVYGSE